MEEKKSPSSPKPKPQNESIEHRGYSLPPTSAKPPMPTVKPPKSE